jgi:predicted CopG family antitoxin
MAVKTITIDLEAYGILARRKTAGESFSQLIKRHFGPQPSAGALRRVIASARPDPSFLDAAEGEVRARADSPARPVEW